MKRRVVITGLGAISPIGNNVKENWQNIKKAVNGIGEITLFDASNFDVKIAAEVKGFDPIEQLGKKEAKRLDRFSQFAIVAAREAFVDSGINIDEVDRDRFGVIIGSGIGGLGTIQREVIKGESKGYGRISPFFVPMSITNIAAGNVAIDIGTKGVCVCIVTACAAGTNSIGEAFRKIRDGYQDIILSGGAEASITKIGIGGFSVMRALNMSNDINRSSIPFDKNRGGFVMGEGSGVIVLEELEHAKKRNAKIYAEIVGYGVTCDANHITAPREDGEGARKCMANALADANLKPSSVDYINAHGTSTPLNDKIESKAIVDLFKEHSKKLKVSSTKSMTGHLLGGSGGIEAIYTTLAIKDGFVPPTISSKDIDQECTLDYVLGQGRNEEINVALSNSLGFGGHNATIAIKKYKE